MNPAIVLAPDFTFPDLRSALDGWQLVSSSEAPIIPSEPEHAVFERGGRERLVYTFNPVCRLRVLEADTTAGWPADAGLPLVTADTIAQWLATDDDRTRLRGVLAAGLVPDPMLVAPVQALTRHPVRAVADAATRTTARFQQASAAISRQSAALAMDVLDEHLQPLLRQLARDADGAVTRQLQPRPDDYEKAFMPDFVEAAREGYQALWRDPPRMPRIARDARIECHFAPAATLADDNLLSRPFPSGYRAIAGALQPNRVWVRWKYIAEGQSAGQAFDGLVWLDDHWAWFPKPFRVLGEASVGQPDT